MLSRYLLHFAQAHNDFRLPELQSVAELHGIAYSLPPREEDRDPTRPFMVIDLEEEEHARILARRCILIKYVFDINQKTISVYSCYTSGPFMNFMGKVRRTTNYMKLTARVNLCGRVMSKILHSVSSSPHPSTRFRNLDKGRSSKALRIWDFLERSR
jgi:tRNA G10  N-methylase Trm11